MTPYGLARQIKSTSDENKEANKNGNATGGPNNGHQNGHGYLPPKFNGFH